MRKQDIKPGVVYAYQRGRGTYDPPSPIVFLNAPADGQVYAEPRRYSSDTGKPAFVKQAPGTKPYSPASFTGSPVGYPVVKLAWNAEGAPEDLLAFTLADFEAATSTRPGEGAAEFDVLTNLAPVVGPYAERVAEYEAARKADQEKARHAAEAREGIRARARHVVADLRAHGIQVELPAYGSVDALPLPLDEAEKLIALLGAKTGQED